MENRTKKFVSITGITVLLILFLLILYFFMNKEDNQDRENSSAAAIENADSDGNDGSEDNTLPEQTEGAALQEPSDDTGAAVVLFEPEQSYDYSFFDKTAEELYEELYTRTEEKGETFHYYVEDGILYLDEYAQTGMQDEEGIYIYEWRRGQKIAEDVIFVDYNWHNGRGALYITADHVLHGTGDYEDVSLVNILFARAYANQMIALTLDGNLWCGGSLFCIGEDRNLEYKGWELILQDVVFANVMHNRFIAITSDESLYMWGDNSLGQMGDGSLLTSESLYTPERYFYEIPVKVADGIKMVWEGHPGNPKETEEYGDLRTYFLTTDNELFVCGENVGEEKRAYDYFGLSGYLEESTQVNCTSVLHKVAVP